ncbi:MAG TPA: hypothetical protein VLR26_05085 [Frankiaceae bacterium]|nr:hypothetical protein [Frankiaceae bacterium]
MGTLTSEIVTFDPNATCPSWCVDRGKHEPERVDDGAVHHSFGLVLPVDGGRGTIKLERTVDTPGPEAFGVQPGEIHPKVWISVGAGEPVLLSPSASRLLMAGLAYYAV